MAPSGRSSGRVSSAARERVSWDEANLHANHKDAIEACRQKIDEPKTPFHYATVAEKSQDGDGASGTDYHEHQLQAGMHDLSKLSASALERREAPMFSSDAESGDEHGDGKRRQFDEHRKAHYKTGGLAALRAQAAALGEDEDDDDVEAVAAKNAQLNKEVLTDAAEARKPNGM
uniref:Protein phosphatase inhibitor 2 n=1 Tax=Chrysotila carterae TaxID=13221 RepID=A0A7S4FDD6_CHRCT|mmetsp:Transcript_42636/g.93414  ORF Transcript_42636/g.93414 Transcript_42636/m.93414 type:complete len:174 (+) Transcript_42636:172-693(+)